MTEINRKFSRDDQSLGTYVDDGMGGKANVLAVLAVQQTADASMGRSDGDYSPLQTDPTGRLKVNTQPGNPLPLTQDITANGGTVVMDVSQVSNLSISVVATALVGHNAVFEYSNNSTNGTDGNWYWLQAIRSNANTFVEVATGTLTSTPGYGWKLSVNGYRWFRVRAVAHTSGTATYTLQGGVYATEPIPSGSLSIVSGQTAEDAGVWGNAVRISGRVRTGAPTTFVNNDTADLTMTTNGAAVVKPFSVPDMDWQYAAAAGGITVNTAVAVKAAAGTGLRNYVTGLDVCNASPTVATEVVVLDGTTVVWRTRLAPGAQLAHQFLIPLKGTAATALNVQVLTAAVVYFNAQGYVAA